MEEAKVNKDEFRIKFTKMETWILFLAYEFAGITNIVYFILYPVDPGSLMSIVWGPLIIITGLVWFLRKKGVDVKKIKGSIVLYAILASLIILLLIIHITRSSVVIAASLLPFVVGHLLVVLKHVRLAGQVSE